MSDVPQGEGWWQASDGRWYPPQQVTTTARPQFATKVDRPALPLAGPKGEWSERDYLRSIRAMMLFWTVASCVAGFAVWLSL